ncbi:hypothetical protein BD626DRAFT_637692 [Schizophyllum amplum]|uniref:Uncharacterized protein n=1 Tax=Schizophyllum amplum TaxID=97359 RepID=A0A550BS84_9AGAR|nr:hypothetical protein BD626DRAFT_637692 [Auriculariopsis ampla]
MRDLRLQRCVVSRTRAFFVMWRRFRLPTCLSTLQASTRASAPSLTRLPADDTAFTLLLPEFRPNIRMMTRWPPDTARGRGSTIPLRGCSASPHLPSESKLPPIRRQLLAQPLMPESGSVGEKPAPLAPSPNLPLSGVQISASNSPREIAVGQTSPGYHGLDCLVRFIVMQFVTPNTQFLNVRSLYPVTPDTQLVNVCLDYCSLYPTAHQLCKHPAILPVTRDTRSDTSSITAQGACHLLLTMTSIRLPRPSASAGALADVERLQLPSMPPATTSAPRSTATLSLTPLLGQDERPPEMSADVVLDERNPLASSRYNRGGRRGSSRRTSLSA